jgi:bifunctional UDP-N-acetylglucosamine pyrophosphorylase/glucosamine-1-phosphate N-acetyltransferase
MTSQSTAAKLAVVVLAAGKGTRMRSRHPKVMHAVAGRPMIRHVLDALEPLAAAQSVVVLGPDMPALAEAVRPAIPVVQEERLGTGHAVLTAESVLGDLAADPDAEVLVALGDTPLVTSETFERLRRARRDTRADLAVLGFRPAEPGAYGRLICDAEGGLKRIVEAKDASDAERAVDLCNAGMICIAAPLLFDLLRRVGNENAKGEYYLTDIVGLAVADGRRASYALAPEAEVQGVNSRADLAAAEAAMQTRLRQAAMTCGATLVAPESVTLCADTVLAPDVVVHPHVVFGPGVTVGEGAEIKSFSHIEGARIAAGARIGPHARLRPGAEIGEAARVGNFVEVKNARLGPGAKANHLSYLGDAEVDEGANIGAGTITCNYDGFQKARTSIGAGAFIGSNTALVAPVRVGTGAIVGAGSTITADVPDDGLALARATQTTRKGAAARFRELRVSLKRGGVE